MKTYVLTGLLASDLAWLDLKLRNDFDALPEVLQYNQALEVIAMAERMGRKELAAEMRKDLGMPMLERAGILDNEPIENNMDMKILGGDL